VIYNWLANNESPAGIPPARIEGFRNKNGQINTTRVDSKVIHETDTGEAKSDESRWMRVTLDTVGKTDWTLDKQGRPVYPEGFEELGKKLGRPLHPPGRDIRCRASCWSRAAPGELRNWRGWEIHGGSLEGAWRSFRGDPVQGNVARAIRASREALSRARDSRKSAIRDSLPSCRSRLRDSVFVQRPNARLHAGLHRSTQVPQSI
jgi:hypothetical protein